MLRKLLALALAFMLFSCKPYHDEGGGKTVFRYNESSGITSIDPAYSKDLANIWPCNQLFNSLLDLDEHLKPSPSLARSWEISEDGLTYTFYLRDDICFHDHPLFKNGKGRKVMASDVVYSFRRILDPKIASPGAWVFAKVAFEEGQPAFRAVNDTVFQVRLKEPFPPFPGILTMKYCSVVPREVVEHYGPEFRKNPVGTGPFRLKLWKEGVKMVLVKNDNYFEFDDQNRLPYIDAVAITFKIDKQAAFLEFVKGNLDFLSGIDPAYKDEVLTADGKLKDKYNGKCYMLSTPYLNTEYLGILVDTSLETATQSPLRVKGVRQAMSLGIDRSKMTRFLRNNLVTPGHYGILPPGLGAHDPTRIHYGYDPDRARELLAEAGYPNGEGIGPIALYTTSDYTDIFKFLQYQYADIGLKIDIEVTPYATLKELKAQAKVNFFRASWIADYPDEENYLSLFFSKNFAPSGPNYTHFSNSTYDSLFLLSQQTQEDTARLHYYRLMNEIIMEEAPVIILYYDQVVRLISPEITDLGVNPLNMLDLKRVKITRK